jgi:hypothetical protein
MLNARFDAPETNRFSTNNVDTAFGWQIFYITP